MDDNQTMHAMGIDDAYHVERVLARSARGVTELVTIDGIGPFVRKKIPFALAQRNVWSALNGSSSTRLPHVEATYELPDCFAVILDYVPGLTLAEEVAEHGRLQLNAGMDFIAQVCEAVQELHQLGILHRDLTPTNIVISQDGAHIIDLGIARVLTESHRRDRDTTALGTYGFAPPEQYGFAPTDVRSDVYSIGRVLGFMLTGVYPDDPLYNQLLSDEDVVSRRMRDIVNRATAFEPSARYQNVADLRRALELPEDPIDSPANTLPQQAIINGTFRRHMPFVISAVAMIVVVLMVTGAVIIPRILKDTGENNNPDVSGAQSSQNQHPPIAPSTQSGEQDGQPDENPLELVETGWSADNNGYVYYAVGLRNTSSTVRVNFPEIEVTGRDDTGAILFSDVHTLMAAFPGQTIYSSDLAGNGNGEVPVTVDFTVLEPETYNYVNSDDGVTFEAVNLNTSTDDYGGTIFSGEITVTDDSADIRKESSQIEISVVLRDERGSIIYGSMPDFVDWPPEGGSRPFSITVYDAPDYASYEVSAMVW